MLTKIKLSCNCEFEEKDGEIVLDYNLDKINFDCKEVWDLISSGKTVGLFQIDSGLGQMMSKKLKPQNITHLAALISIMRPSCLQGKMSDGKSIADHYIDRKNGVEKVKIEYEALKDILKDNYQMMIYQEDAIKIANEIAGFDLIKSDDLRKAIGKKKADLMSELESDFIAGCLKVGKVNNKQAQEIFDQIKASQRFSFNKSHAISYAIMSYLTAIPKAHTKKRFYKSWLNHSHDKIKPFNEIKNLVVDARANSIDVCNPDIRLKNRDFIIKDGRIYFGLQHIKGIGESSVRTFLSVLESIEHLASLETLSWGQMLFALILKANKTIIKHTLAVGAWDFTKLSREKMLFDHDTILKLTKKEVDWIENNLKLENFDHLLDILNEVLKQEPGKGQGVSNKNRKNIIKGLQYGLVKTPYNVKVYNSRRICALESSYLGIPLSIHKTDISEEIGDTTIKEILDGKNSECKLLVELEEVKQILTKIKKEEMAFIIASDQSGVLSNIVIFPNQYKEYRDMLFEGNTCVLIGYLGEKGSFIVNVCRQV